MLCPVLAAPTNHFDLQRKLSAPEYKEVDEEYRVAMIKYETTQMAVKDIEKYHSALDKVSATASNCATGSRLEVLQTFLSTIGTLEVSQY